MGTKAPTGPPCELHQVHHPSVTRNVRWGIDSTDVWVWVCPTGSANLDACVHYMRGTGPAPSVKIGRSTWDVAQRAVTALERANAVDAKRPAA